MSQEQKEHDCTPRLRFPEFAGIPWIISSIKDCCEFYDHKRKPMSSSLRNKGPYPYYGAAGIIDYIDSFIFDEKLLLVGEDGAKWGAFEKTAFIADGKYWVNNHAHVLKAVNVSDIFLKNYFYFFDFSKFITGAAPPKLTLGKLKSVMIPLPKSEREQQKIADCLSSLDDLITAHEQKRDALTQHKKGLMQRLFPAEGETTPRWRFPEFRGAGEWSSAPLGKVATFYNGRAYKQEELLDKGKYRVLRVGNLFKNDNWYYSNLELEIDKYCEVGDLLYAWSASFGPFIWMFEKAIYHYHIWKVVPQKDVYIKFLFYILDMETSKIKENMLNGLGIMHITKHSIENWQCHLPPLPEQQKIADCLSALDERIAAQEAKIAALREHKKGLMQQLFPQ